MAARLFPFTMQSYQAPEAFKVSTDARCTLGRM